MGFPYASVKKVILNAGEMYQIQRVSPEAVKELQDILETICLKLSKEAGNLANHAGRSTVRSEDIKLTRIDLV